MTQFLNLEMQRKPKKSYFEMTNVTIVSDEKIKEKKLEKIILCDLQNEIYPFLEKSF